MPTLQDSTSVTGVWRLNTYLPRWRLEQGSLGFIFEDPEWFGPEIWFGYGTYEIDNPRYHDIYANIEQVGRPLVMPGDIIYVTRFTDETGTIRFRSRVLSCRWTVHQGEEGIAFVYKPENRPFFIASTISDFLPFAARDGSLEAEQGLLRVEPIELYEERRR